MMRDLQIYIWSRQQVGKSRFKRDLLDYLDSHLLHIIE